jgi:hypothetical protein
MLPYSLRDPDGTPPTPLLVSFFSLIVCAGR